MEKVLVSLGWILEWEVAHSAHLALQYDVPIHFKKKNSMGSATAAH
jgi:hypothetical protein